EASSAGDERVGSSARDSACTAEGREPFGEDMSVSKERIGRTGTFHAQAQNRNRQPHLIQRRRRALGPAVAAVTETLEQRRLLAGQGLFGEYFDSPSETQWTSPATRRHDPRIEFEWSSGKMIDGIGTDGAVQWTGLIAIPTAGNYTFFAETDDGVRLWIDGNLVIDDWTEGAGERSSSAIALAAGQHTIKMQYFGHGSQCQGPAALAGAGDRQADHSGCRAHPRPRHHASRRLDRLGHRFGLCRR